METLNPWTPYGRTAAVRRLSDGRTTAVQSRKFFSPGQFPFAPVQVSVADMSTPKPIPERISASELRQLKARSFVGRSDVYRYLRKNFARLTREKAGTDVGPSWDEVAALMSKRGYVSFRGDRLNGNAVRRVFRRVEQDLQREKASEPPKPSGPSWPSRQRPDWQPPLTNAPRVAPAVRPRYEPEEELPPRRSSPTPQSQAPPDKSQSITIDDLPPEARAMLDRVKQELLEDDYKKFGRP